MDPTRENTSHALSGFGLYIHLPFCRSRCPYCAFCSTADGGEVMPSYADAAASELHHARKDVFEGQPLTAYIGGGTPSTVPPQLIEHVLGDIDGEQVTEFTVEANPESVTPAWLKDMRRLGANRLSVGVQSMDDGVLKHLGRIHDAEQARDVCRMARMAGFKNLSIDLMFGVPGQNFGLWRETLVRAVALKPDHLSCYSLSVEEDTEYFRRFSNDRLPIPSSGETADMYLHMCSYLASEGYGRYELSSFAREGNECRHNIRYWNGGPYLGVGASAHSFDGRKRWWNTNDIGKYISMYSGNCPVTQEFEILDVSTRNFEKLMLGLRTRVGIALTFLRSCEREPGEIDILIETYVKSGMLSLQEDHLVLSDRGAVCADEITAEIAAAML